MPPKSCNMNCTAHLMLEANVHIEREECSVGTALAAWSQYALHSSVHNRHTTGNKKQLRDTQASHVMTSCSTLIEARMEQNQALLLSWNVPSGADCTPNYLPNPVLPLGRADVYRPSLHKKSSTLLPGGCKPHFSLIHAYGHGVTK